MKRPAPIAMGAVLMLARVLTGAVTIAIILANVPLFIKTVLDDAVLDADDLLIAGDLVNIGVAVYGAWLALYLVLAWLVWRGVNWARIAAMSLATLSILVPFVDWWRSDLEISLRTTLLSVALDILILLALSSRTARAYARRNEAPAPASIAGASAATS